MLIKRLLLVISALACLAALPLNATAQSTKKKTPAKKQRVCPATLAACPSTGCGGDPNLSQVKNKTTAPRASDVEDWDIADVIELNDKSPKSWKVGAERKPLRDIGEGTAVAIKGYLIHAKLTGAPEACNCFIKGHDSNDFHLNIVPTKAGTMQQSLVIEMSPRSRKAGWKLPTLQALAGTTSKSYVRVTGWLIYDSAHAHFQSMPRATAWEIHPVMKFEVCQGTKKECDKGDKWVALESL